MNRLVIVAALALAVAGCGKQADHGAKAAGGEVLPGTISDAMIDTSQSQAEPVLMPVKVAKARDAAEDQGEASTGATDSAAAPAPAPAPAPAGAPASTDAPRPATTKAP